MYLPQRHKGTKIHKEFIFNNLYLVHLGVRKVKKNKCHSQSDASRLG